MEPPYVRQYTTVGSQAVWFVDGVWIRKNKDPDFPNFGQHYRYDYIPLHEFWIDWQRQAGEEDYYLIHLNVEYALIQAGVDYKTANDQATEVEWDARNAVGKDPTLTLGKIELSQYSQNKFKVCVVNGEYVRYNLFPKFTAGGNYMVYKFVPRPELWLDNDLMEEDRPFALLHEAHETNQMEQMEGKIAEVDLYWKCHEDALKVEKYARQNPEELPRLLAEEDVL